MNIRFYVKVAGAVAVSGMAFATSAAGCSSGDENTPPLSDSGAGDSAIDARGPADAGTDSPPRDAEPILARAKILLVNASADDSLALRFCFALGSEVAPIQALPDQSSGGQPYPGIFPGAGGPVPPPNGVDFSQFGITTYAILAEAIRGETADGGTAGGTQRQCPELLAGLQENRQYWSFPRLPAGTLARGTTWILAVTGCRERAADPAAHAARCGASYEEARGNVEVKAIQVHRAGAKADDGAVAFRFAHLSSQAEGALAANGLYPFLIMGNTAVDLGGPLHMGHVTENATNVVGFNPTAGSLLVSSDRADAGGSSLGGQAPQPIPVAEAYTVGPGQPEYIHPGKSYTIVYLGDPAVTPPMGGAPGTAGHLLVFPSDP